MPRIPARRDEPSRPSPQRTSAPPHSVLALQQSAGNQAVARWLARAEQPQSVELEYVEDPGADLPQATVDPRSHSDYVDRRVQAVAYSAYNGFVVFVGDDQPPVLVPEEFFDFASGATEAVAASPVIHGDREQAMAAVPVGPLAEGQAVPYALYRGALGVVAPTTLSLATAPLTVRTALDARRRYAEQVADELTTAVVTIAGMVLGALALRGIARAAGRRFEAKLREAPGGPKPAEPAVEPAVAAATLRRRATRFDLREMLQNNRDYVTFRTGREDVASNLELSPQGQTNAALTDEVCFMEGLEGGPYGPWHVTVRKGDIPGLHAQAGAAGEWRTPHNVPADKGVWYHHDDYLAAKKQ